MEMEQLPLGRAGTEHTYKHICLYFCAMLVFMIAFFYHKYTIKRLLRLHAYRRATYIYIQT